MLSYQDWLQDTIKGMRYYKVIDGEGRTLNIHSRQANYDLIDVRMELGFSWLSEEESPGDFTLLEISYAEYKREQEKLEEIDKLLRSRKAFECYREEVESMCDQMRSEAKKAWDSIV